MAFHCGAPTRDGSACQRHVREPGTRCPQHRNLGGTALHPPRHAMRTITLADPALTSAPTAWKAAQADLTARAGELRGRTTPPPDQESAREPAGTLGDEEQMTEHAEPADGTGTDEAAARPTPVGQRSYLDRERSRRGVAGAAEVAAATDDGGTAAAESEVEREHSRGASKAAEEVAGESEGEAEAAARESYLDRERAARKRRAEEAAAGAESSREPEDEPSTAEPTPAADQPPAPELSAGQSSADTRTGPEPVAADAQPEAEPAPEPEPDSEADPEPESRPSERPLLRKERALDPDWIGARPLFRDEAPTRPLPRIEFEPSADVPRKPPRVAPMRSVVLGAQAEPDPPTLIDRMPPIDPDDLVVPDFLRADFAPASDPPKPEPAPPKQAPTKPAPPKPRPAAVPDPPTLVDPHPPIAAGDISVPDFIVPGFTEPAPKPPLRTVLSTVLGPDLWQRCYAEWSAAHCAALARIARAVDGLAPSATTAVRSTAGAGMRWLGVAREREMLADEVAEAISHPAGATTTNQARTVRLYGAAICMALNVPLRRCSCHRDLERDVSSELIRLGLEELAGEVP